MFCSCNVVIWGYILLYDLLYYDCYFFSCSCFELWCFCGLVGTCLIIIPGTTTPSGLVLPCIIFWGLTPFLNFLHCFNLSLTSDAFFLFFKDFGNQPLIVPFLLSKTYCNSSLDLWDFFWMSIFFFNVTSKCSWNIYLNNFFKSNAKWQIYFLSSCFPLVYIFSHILVHLSSSLHKSLNMICV